MAIYVYQHPKTKKVIEIVQSMNEEHCYTDKKGVKWNRIYTVPQASIDASIDPWSARQFDEKTGQRGAKMGDLYDRSSELSEKRAAINGGVDPIKQKYYDDYSKKCRGKTHFHKQKEKIDKTTFEI